MNQRPIHIVPPCASDVRIVYHDDYLVVIDKPEPMLSTPGRLPENKDSAITRVQRLYPSAELVHRLDMATSGLMVISLSKLMNRELSILFQKRQVDKTYIAVLDGHVADNHGLIDIPIITDWENRPLQKVCYETGKSSQTEYLVLERFDNGTTRVQFNPLTGRSHQLRLHSLAIGHPILGCNLYALNGSERKAQRLLLHAQNLSFTHPITQQTLSFMSAAPF